MVIMMLPTHVLIGLAVAVPVAMAFPEHGTAVLVGGIVGSILPDLDLYAGHRRTLHYPTLYVIAAGPAVLVAIVLQRPLVSGIAFVLLAAAVHCRLDRYGGGLALRPWEERTDRGVYDHVKGMWRAPKRWIRYDGAPEDLGLAVGLAAALWFVAPASFQPIVALAVLVGTVYAVLRRRLAELAPVVFGAPPEPVREYLPGRYQEPDTE